MGMVNIIANISIAIYSLTELLTWLYIIDLLLFLFFTEILLYGVDLRVAPPIWQCRGTWRARAP